MASNPKARNAAATLRPRLMFTGIGLMVVLLLLALLMVGALIQVQSNAMAYIDAASAWSRAQISAVHYLDRYATSGDAIELERARHELDVMDGDRQARIAMEASDPDMERIRDGFRRGQVPEEKIAGMVRFYQWFGGLRYFHTATGVWRKSDFYLDELLIMADALEAEWADGPPDPGWTADTRMRLTTINETMGGLNSIFRAALQQGSRHLRANLIAAGVLFLVLVASLAGLVGWRLNRRLLASERKFRAIFAQAGVGLAQLDRGGHFLEVNDALCRILARPASQLLSMRYADISHPEDLALAEVEGNKLVAGERSCATLEQRFLRGDGEPVWLRVTASPLHDSDEPFERYTAVVEDVSESHRLSEQLGYQSTHDPLTGLLNRRAFERQMAETLAQTRSRGREAALCFLNLDHFRIINDTYGHGAGDQLLQEIAGLLRGSLRIGDHLARLSADEFAMVIEDCDLDAAAAICEKLRQKLMGYRFRWGQKTTRITASIGVVAMAGTSGGIGKLLRSADMACQIAKEQGRNRVHISARDDEQLGIRQGQARWVANIHAALDDGRFSLDAQYVTPLNVPDELRYELLIRMRDENGERCPPGEFLPSAERFGAIHKIDCWVVETVCRRLAEHPSHLKRLGACHVNISGDSVGRVEFQEFIQNCMTHYAIPPQKLCLEITETAAIADLPAAIRFLDALSAQGCSFALDDFGVGQSSFGYLRRLKADYLKIDGSFVRDIHRDATDLAMVRAINQVGLALGKKTIAECVETREVGRILKNMGVHYAQGWAYHHAESWTQILQK